MYFIDVLRAHGQCFQHLPLVCIYNLSVASPPNDVFPSLCYRVLPLDVSCERGVDIRSEGTRSPFYNELLRRMDTQRMTRVLVTSTDFINHPCFGALLFPFLFPLPSPRWTESDGGCSPSDPAGYQVLN